MVKARRAYDAIYLLQRFARYVGGQAALALAAEVVLFKQRRLCKRVERLHGTRQKRRAEREATDRLAVSIQNASRRRKAPGSFSHAAWALAKIFADPPPVAKQIRRIDGYVRSNPRTSAYSASFMAESKEPLRCEEATVSQSA